MNPMQIRAQANRFRIWQRAKQGYSPQQIASLCELSPSTVYNHLAELRLREPRLRGPEPEHMGTAAYMECNGHSFFHGRAE